MHRPAHYKWLTWFALLVFVFCLFSFASASRDAGTLTTTTREGRLAVFDDVWQTVHDRYYDANFHGVDWPAQRSILRGQAGDAGGQQELYAVLRRMLASLLDAHTRVYAPDEKFDWQHPRFVGIGVSLREVEGHPTVVAVDSGSAPAHAGIRPGDVIVNVDGEPAALLLDQRLREQVGSSTPQAARSHAVTSLLGGPPNTDVRIVWRTIDNEERSASFHREWHDRSLTLQIAHRRGGFSVVTIDAFTWPIARDLSRALLGKLGRVRGLVLDLRNNGGGDAEAMAGVASYFLPAGTGLGEFTNRAGNVALSLETHNSMLLSADRLARVTIPIIVLTSDRTSSAAEILVAALQDARRTPVIGGDTCGCVLAIRTRHVLPDGGELDLSELDYRTAQRVRLEGRGITPDLKVSLSRQDLYFGRDRAVELALTRLKSVGVNGSLRSAFARH